MNTDRKNIFEKIKSPTIWWDELGRGDDKDLRKSVFIHVHPWFKLNRSSRERARVRPVV
jgi:hypothetical protein